LPTIASAGVPGYEWIALIGFFAPAATPPAVVRLLNREIVQALHREDVKTRLFNSGVEVAGNTPEEFAAVIKADIVRTGKVIREAGISGE
jgi:tripartite-type tricarboxylate transporter receptor subunit TctC